MLDVLQHQFGEMPEKDVDNVAEALDSQGAWIESKWLREVADEAMAEAMDRPSPVQSTMKFPSPEELLGPTGMAAVEKNFRKPSVMPRFDGPAANFFIENIVKPIQAQADGDDEL